MTVAQSIADLLRCSVETMGFQLWGVEYIASGKHSILRIYIDSELGIKVKDCEMVSHQVSSILDVENIINTQYTLEVSSPGIERPLFSLEHYQRFLGFDVKIRLFRQLDGGRKWVGNIKQLKDNKLVLATNVGEKEIDIALIDKANLMANF